MASPLFDAWVSASPYGAFGLLGWIVFRVECVLSKIHQHEVKLATIEERCRIVGHSSDDAL